MARAYPSPAPIRATAVYAWRSVWWRVWMAVFRAVPSEFAANQATADALRDILRDWPMPLMPEATRGVFTDEQQAINASLTMQALNQARRKTRLAKAVQ